MLQRLCGEVRRHRYVSSNSTPSLDVTLSLRVVLISAGGPHKKKILRYLREVSRKATMPKDVENLMAEMRRHSRTSADVNKRVKDVLQDLCEEGVNVANAFRSEYCRTTCITFQTKPMLQMFKIFPEVVCVDATYGTNASK